MLLNADYDLWTKKTYIYGWLTTRDDDLNFHISYTFGNKTHVHVQVMNEIYD